MKVKYILFGQTIEWSTGHRCDPLIWAALGLSWTSCTPAKSYPRQLVPEIRDSCLVPSLAGCLPSRTRDGSYPRQVVP